MKTEVIEKLWNDKSLTSQEILFVSKNLSNDDSGLGFNHSATDVLSSCKLTDEDTKRFNILFQESCKDSNIENISEIVEKVEKFTGDPKFLRLIIIQSIMYAKEKNNPLTRRF